MSILTQRVEIYEDSNPLESRFVDIPVHKGEKIMCHEPYVIDALKLYNQSCTDEVMESIAAYERAGKFKDVCEGFVASYDEKKSTAQIYLSEKHAINVDVNPNEKLNVGDKIDVVVSKSHGRLSGDASSKGAQIERLKQELIKEIQTPTSAYIGVVKEIVFNGANVFNGFIVDIKGVRCFMPGIESDVVPLNDYNALVGKELYVMPINVIKDSIVVSHKEYLNTKKPATLERLNSVEKESVITGVISSIKNFGVFILIDECVSTLLSVSEMNEVTESKFKSGQLKVGDAIDMYIDSINGERLTVTQTTGKDDGWKRLKEISDNNKEYVLKGNVKNIFNNGVVIISNEFNDITFFLSSKVVEIEGLSIGQEVALPVESVDTVKKTVRLRID